MDALLAIGGNATENDVRVLAESIVQVATCSPIPEVAVTALKVFRDRIPVNVQVHNSTFIGAPPDAAPDESPPVVGSDHRLAGDL